MKKTYIIPTLTLTQVKTSRMLALSMDKRDTGLSNSAGGDNVQPVKRNNYNIWDDDWNK